MSKKDYELIARVVATIVDDQTRWTIADLFAALLLNDNPSFNVAMFQKACRGKVPLKRAKLLS